MYVCHKKQRQLLLYCMCVLHFPPSTLQQKKYLTRPPVTGSKRQFFIISITCIRISCFKFHSSWQNKVLEIILKRSFFKWIIHLFSSKLLKDLQANVKCITSMPWTNQEVNHDWRNFTFHIWTSLWRTELTGLDSHT